MDKYEEAESNWNNKKYLEMAAGINERTWIRFFC